MTVETELSGVTALPPKEFLGLMTSIHLAIGTIEGIATAVVLSFVANYKPEMLYSSQTGAGSSDVDEGKRKKAKIVIWSFLGAALVMAIGFTWLASENPDGLEWSIAKITGDTELGVASIPSTAIMPDYDSSFAGVIGGVIVMVMLWCICAVLFRKRRAYRKVR